MEYRTRGGRWYFSGRLLGLEEPMPEPPEAPDEEEPPAVASGTPDALDAFRKVVGDAWDDDEDRSA